MPHLSLKDKIILAIVPFLASFVLRLLSLTMRKKVLYAERHEPFTKHGRWVILAFWHQRLLMMPFLRTGEKVSMLISQHRDGELIARTVGHLGIRSIRGSTTRGGLSAIRGMVRAMEDGSHLAITPDGPQGPRHKVQAGIIELARLTGAPIFPVTYSASRRKVFRSWDRFNLPYPFGRVAYLFGEPVMVPRDLNPEEREEKRLLLEDRLRQLTREADQIFNHPDS